MNFYPYTPLAELVRDARFRVKPEHWTQMHLDLAGCTFERANLNQEEVDVSRVEEDKFSDDHELRQRQLLDRHDIIRVQTGLLNVKHAAMQHLMLDGDTPFTDLIHGVSFFWLGRATGCPTLSVFSGPEIKGASVECPRFLVGYYVYAHDATKCYHCYWSGLEHKRRARAPAPHSLTERCPMEEWPPNPYVLSLLLGIAQAQEIINETRDGRPESQTVRLMVSNPTHKHHLHLYEVTFLTEILDAMDRPNLATKHIPWPTVYKKTMRFPPRESFKDRLFAEIVPDTALPAQTNPALR